MVLHHTRERLKKVVKTGGVIPLLLMIPNIFWMLDPQTDAAGQNSVPMELTITENIARIAVLILPFFYPLKFKEKFAMPVAVTMIAVLMM